MEQGRASLTAMGTSLMRADHTRNASRPLIEDSWGDRLVTDAHRDRLREAGLNRLSAEFQERLAALGPEETLGLLLRAHPSYAAIVLRTRYAEDALAVAVEDGVRQYVVIGAGLDSFALRRPAFAAEVEIFEIDHPDTQRFKLDRLDQCGIDQPVGTHFLAADLAIEDVGEVLGRSRFQRSRPAFFSWLGVTAYLTRQDNLKTLRAVSAHGAAGSEIVFDYGDQRAFDSPPTDSASVRIRERMARIGEPWVSGFHPAELERELGAVGLELIENIATEDLRTRYRDQSEDGPEPSSGHYLARARIV